MKSFTIHKAISTILLTILIALTHTTNGQEISNINEKVKINFAKWQQKGEFEKSADHTKRLETNSISAFDSICRAVIIEECQRKLYRPWTMTYDADSEYFRLTYDDNHRSTTTSYFNGKKTTTTTQPCVFDVKIHIPIDEAPKFKERNNNALVAYGVGHWYLDGNTIKPERLAFMNQTYDYIICEANPSNNATVPITISATILENTPDHTISRQYNITEEGSSVEILRLEKLPNCLIGHKYIFNEETKAPQPKTNSNRNSGAGWSLNGRRAVNVPPPSNKDIKEGKIIVKIWVNQEGNVTKVEAPVKGSTITETAIVNKAKAAAMNAKFNADPNATNSQIGTITYIYRSNN